MNLILSNEVDSGSDINRGSYRSAHVLLILLKKLGKRDKVRGLPSILSLFRNEFNKLNNILTDFNYATLTSPYIFQKDC